MIAIINYTEETREFVKNLNYEWLEKYFRVEPGDVISLSDPQREIIDRGGQIFYATYNGHIVGTASLLKVEDGIYELGKMAVTEEAQGLGIGKVLLEHCLEIARRNQASRLILYSNTKLENAIHLYRKYGFKEIPLEAGHYERANIKMELAL
jgi:ribosomal protein S18 acetylase RimI-like enzyme